VQTATEQIFPEAASSAEEQVYQKAAKAAVEQILPCRSAPLVVERTHSEAPHAAVERLMFVSICFDSFQ
jgi:hypothetical protein